MEIGRVIAQMFGGESGEEQAPERAEAGRISADAMFKLAHVTLEGT